MLEIHDRLRLLGEVGKHLVTTPLRVARSTAGGTGPVGRVRAPQGAADHRHQDQRIAALRNYKADIYDQLHERSLPWLVRHLDVAVRHGDG